MFDTVKFGYRKLDHECQLIQISRRIRVKGVEWNDNAENCPFVMIFDQMESNLNLNAEK